VHADNRSRVEVAPATVARDGNLAGAVRANDRKLE